MLPIFFLYYFYLFIFILEEFFLELWKINKVTPKPREQRRIYVYIKPPPPPPPPPLPPPHLLFAKKNFFLQSKFIISFSQLAISYEFGAIYFDISFFSFHYWKINGVFFICFKSVSKSIILRRCFSLELYTYTLKISEKWFIMGSSWFVLSLQSPRKAVCGVSAGKIKSFSKKVANCCQR